MNVQDAKALTITEGEVRTIHASDGKQLWGKLNYNTTYTGDTTQQTYSGKNLASLETSSTKVVGGLNFTTDDGYIHINGTVSSDGEFYFDSFQTNSGSAVFSAEITGYTDNPSFNSAIVLQSSPNQSTWTSDAIVWMTSHEPKSVNVVLDNTLYYRVRILVRENSVFTNATIKPQLEYGNSPTAFEPYVGGIPSPNPDYPQNINVVTGTQTLTITDGVISDNYTLNLGSTELCKIGTYQDYIYKTSDDWYVHKDCGKIVLDGSNDEDWGISYTGTANYFYRFRNISDYLYSGSGTTSINNSGTWANIGSSTTVEGYSITNTGELRIRYGTEMTTANWRNKLSTSNMILYYVLVTSTDTKITDNTLIAQLEAVNEWVTRYGYNATISGNIPLILTQTTLT